MRISPNVAHIKPSATLAVAALARELKAQGRDVIDLSAGEPDFDTPDLIRDAGIASIREGRTRYTAVPGLPELRAAIARELSRGRDYEASAGLVVVSTGAKQALFNACFTLFGPGDRVLLPTPYWTSYPELVHLARAEPVPVHGDEARDFRVTPDDLDAAWSPAVKGLILNSPSNPSGAVYPLAEIEAIVEWAERRDVAIISDEIYNRICFTEERAPGLLDLGRPLAPRSVIVGGASKNYAMTGWRIGYSYAGQDLTARMSALQSHVTSHPSAPAQYASIVAFGDEALPAVRRMADIFRARRDFVVQRFGELMPDVRYVQPDGAFYLFFRIDGFEASQSGGSIAFCEWLLENAGIALVPGAAFGDDRYVRLSYASAEDTLRAGIDRIAEAVAAEGAGSTAG